MAQLAGGTNVAIRMDELSVGDLFDGDVTSSSSTLLRIDLGEGYIDTFTGTGFSFNNDGEPIGGTITGISETLNGSTTFNVTGLSTSATQFYAFVPADNTGAALNLLFSGNDDMKGTAFNDLLDGFSGHDNLFGGAGSDTLYGGDGNDHLFGQSANGGSDGADFLSGEGGNDYLQGNAANDSLDGGDGSDRINGGADQDSIRGGAGNDSVNGNLGNDSIDGGSGNDSLRGGQGNDSILGGDGNDVISGDLGVDTLGGGAGTDYFVFSGNAALFTGAAADVISDFQDGIDRLQVGFAPAITLSGANQASFSAAAAAAQQLFDGHAGNAEVAALAIGSDTYLFYSGNGGGSVDSAIQLVGVNSATIGLSDFG
jgi:serralysin